MSGKAEDGVFSLPLTRAAHGVNVLCYLAGSRQHWIKRYRNFMLWKSNSSLSGSKQPIISNTNSKDLHQLKQEGNPFPFALLPFITVFSSLGFWTQFQTLLTCPFSYCLLWSSITDGVRASIWQSGLWYMIYCNAQLHSRFRWWDSKRQRFSEPP